MKPRGSIVVQAWRLAAMGLLAIATPSIACINSFQTDILNFQDQGNESKLAEIISGLEAAFQKDHSLEHGNDLAVARVLTHRYDEAIELLQDTERRFPGKAIVAANLGTALELKGDSAEALRWIREGVRRDPKEHRGSEWLHVRILETKEALAKNPAWLATNTVLGVNFGKEFQPRANAPMPADEHGSPRKMEDVFNAINYQLHERTKFVKPPDAIVADLYAAQADLSMVLSGPYNFLPEFGDAGSLYELALKFGPANAEIVQRRYDELHRMLSTQRSEAHSAVAVANVPYPLVDGWRDGPFNLWLILAGVAIGIGGAWWWRRQSRIKRP